MKISFRNIATALLTVSFITSCSDAGFNGKSGSNKKKPIEIKESFHLSCNDQFDKVIDFNATVNDNVSVRLTGEICPQKSNDLTVLFVVDFSGSMGRHTPTNSQTQSEGNDPQVGGSCGRLKAVQAIVNRLTGELDYGDKVRVGMVPFAGGVLQDRIVQPLELQFFQEDMSAERLCSYVVQSSSYGYDPQNPGGIAGRVVNSATNYEAAFNSAESVLSQTEGRKVVYFISDGQPTAGTSDPIEAGVAAGQRLKNLEDLTLNSLLLGQGQQIALDVLKRVSGDAEHVRVVGKASELAKEIVKFPKPELKIPTARAYYSVLGQENLLKLKEFKKITNSQWTYKTDYIKLNADRGEKRDHIIRITVDGDEDITVSTGITVRFHQQD